MHTLLKTEASLKKKKKKKEEQNSGLDQQTHAFVCHSLMLWTQLQKVKK